MTKYAKLMSKARRKNRLHADAAWIGMLLSERGAETLASLQELLIGSEKVIPWGFDPRINLEEMLRDAIHEEDWNLVAEALDTLQSLRRAYREAEWKRRRYKYTPYTKPEQPQTPPQKYLQ